jgi:EAL domain-containing protein (putative c-di-GMP-specific phosphodiesterase class I)
VRQVLEETELQPSSLVLEITESGLMQRTTGTIGRLAELRALGIHLAIDDFGTAELTPSGERPAIARAIVELGRTLGLHVVAKGIEQPDQAEWLISLGCAYGQGYLYSRPLGVDAIEAFLAADASRRAQTAGAEAAAGRSGTRVTQSRRRQPRRLRLVSGG